MSDIQTDGATAVKKGSKPKGSRMDVFGATADQLTANELRTAITGYDLRYRIEAVVAGITEKKLRHVYQGDGAATGREVMILPSIPQTKLFAQEHANIILGYTMHETCHQLHTDFSLLEKIFAGNAKPTKREMQLKSFWNAIEDYRIEKIGRIRYPGFHKFISATRHHSAKRFVERFKDGEVPPAYVANPYAIGAVALTWVGAKLNKYPTPMSEEALRCLPDDLRAWTESWAPDMAKVNTNQEAFDLANRILDDLDAQRQDQSQDDSASGDPGDSDQQDPNQQNSQSQSGQGNAPQDPQDDSSDDQGDQDDQDQSADQNADDQSPDQPDNQASDKSKGKPDKNGKPEDASGDESGDDGSEKDDDSAEDSKSSGSDNDAADESQAGDDESDDDANASGNDGDEGENGEDDSQDDGSNQSNGDADDTDGSQSSAPDGSDQADSATDDQPSSGQNDGDQGDDSSPANDQDDGDANSSRPANGDSDDSSSASGDDDASDPAKGTGSNRPQVKVNDGDEEADAAEADLEIDEISKELGDKTTDIDRIMPDITEDVGRTETTEIERGQKRYTQIRGEIGPAAARAAGIMRRLLMAKNVTRTRRELDEGSLDLGRLVPIATGSSNVYKRIANRSDVNTAVSIMVDNSGSMHGVPITVCQQAAIVLDMAIQGTKADLEINGFTGGVYEPWVYRYRTFGQKGQASSASLGNMDSVSMGGTPVSQAMLDAWRRLNAHKAPRKILIIITDGDADDQKRSKEVHDLVVAMGGLCIGIGIGNVASLGKWCSNTVQVNQITDLPIALSQIVQQAMSPTRRAA